MLRERIPHEQKKIYREDGRFYIVFTRWYYYFIVIIIRRKDYLVVSLKIISLSSKIWTLGRRSGFLQSTVRKDEELVAHIITGLQNKQDK